MSENNEKQLSPEDAFFKLIRLAVGTCHDRNVRLDEAGWAAVYEMSRKQALAAIVIDGVERLPLEQKPPMDVLMSWISLVQQVEERNRRLNKLAVMVCDKFRREDIGCVVLKGQGNAVFYPRPLHRMPGDIDLWMNVGRKELVRYVRRYRPEAEVVYHHVDFDVLKDAPMELHFTPSWMNCWLTNRRLQRYFKEWAALSFLHRTKLPGGVGEIPVPTLAMNRIYLLVHIYRHLFDEGIGLRQLMDYYYVLRRPCSDAERKEAVQVLRRLHLMRFASAVMYVLQEVFGMRDEHLLVPPSAGRGRRLLREVMLAGNFGQYDERIRRKAHESPLHRFCRKVARNFGFLFDYPSEVLWSPLFKIWQYAWRSYHGYLPARR